MISDCKTLLTRYLPAPKALESTSTAALRSAFRVEDLMKNGAQGSGAAEPYTGDPGSEAARIISETAAFNISGV